MWVFHFHAEFVIFGNKDCGFTLVTDVNITFYKLHFKVSSTISAFNVLTQTQCLTVSNHMLQPWRHNNSIINKGTSVFTKTVSVLTIKDILMHLYNAFITFFQYAGYGRNFK